MSYSNLSIERANLSTNSCAVDNTEPLNALSIIRRLEKEKLPRLRSIDGNRKLLSFPMARVAFIIDDRSKELRQLLDGLVVSKNAGKKGLASNWLLKRSIQVAAALPSWLLPTAKIHTPYQFLSWRKGMRYRLIDLRNRSILDWAKPGGEQYVLREIHARTNLSTKLFIPELIHCDAEGQYFCHRLVDGASLLAAPRAAGDRQSVLDRMFSGLRDLYGQTQRAVVTTHYVDELTEKVNRASALPERVRRTALMLLNKELDRPKSTYLAQAHGDLNLGNIVWERETSENYLIDWESTAEHSLLYDAFNLHIFVTHVHRIRSLDTHRYLRMPWSDSSEKTHLSFYRSLFFVERMLIWANNPNRDLRWIIMLDKIARTESL
ncbi:MAG: hypothetical protein AAF438_15030 [Pseudomonadota bacterium]